MKNKKGFDMGYFQEVTPQSVGIDPQGIYAFLQGVKEEGLEMHRLMILRHGKCCTKMTWDPYTQESMHPVYSFTKSLTATAIAFARQEGILSLDEKIVDIFPEKVPENPSDNLKACTIRHLLTMSCGHEVETHDKGPDFLKSFFHHPFKYQPGTFFEYNTAGSNVLAAIILRKTGQQLTDYLRSRLFEPLGMEHVICQELPDELHTQAGGGGMQMQLEDMAKFGQFMLQDGWWEGKCLLKDWYLKMAGIKQIETEGDRAGHIKDWAQGYGFQCWMNTAEASFRADGAFGQFALVYPKLDLCVIINAATEQTQTMMDVLNSCLIPVVSIQEEKEEADRSPKNLTVDTEKVAADKAAADEVAADEAAADETTADETAAKSMYRTHGLFSNRRLPAVQSCANPVFEQKLEKVLYQKCDENEPMDGIKRLAGGAGLYTIPEDGSISGLRFSFEKDTVVIDLFENGEWKTLKAARNGRFALSDIDGYTYAACAGWRGLRRLELEIRRMDAMSGVRLILQFLGNELTFEADETLMTDGGLGMTDRKLAKFFTAADLEASDIEKTGNNPAVNQEEKKC